MQPNDWFRLTTVSQPAMSPDGRQVAFTVTTVNEKENKRHQEVWMVPTAGGDAVRYTAPGYESSGPRFSPDGKYLFFSSSRPGGTGNSWAIRMDAPGGEAAQVGDYPTGSWPRDGKFAVFAATVTEDSANAGAMGAGIGGPNGAAGRGGAAAANDPFGRMQPMARPPFGAITRPVDPARFDGRHITEARYKANGQGFLPGPRQARVIRPQQLFTQVPGAKRVQLTNTTYSHRSPVVSPDGKWIAFTADVALKSDSAVTAYADSIAELPYDAVRDEADRNETDIYVLPVAGGTPRKVATLMGAESDLTWSPDGKRIAFVSRPGRVKQAVLAVADVATGAVKVLTEGWRFQATQNRQGSEGKLPAELGEKLTEDERHFHKQARKLYVDRLEAGVAREQARKDLPLSTFTEAYWKIDLHNLLHFLALRCDEHAQQEIRLYAQTIGEEIVAPLFPAVWEAFVDFRRNALQLTGPEVQVVQRLATRARLDPSAPWTEADFLAVQDPAWAPLVRCRERDECRSKLVRLGLLTPPIEVPAPPA